MLFQVNVSLTRALENRESEDYDYKVSAKFSSGIIRTPSKLRNKKKTFAVFASVKNLMQQSLDKREALGTEQLLIT